MSELSHLCETQIIVGVKPRYPNEFAYRQIDAVDYTGENLSSHLVEESNLRFIDEGREKGGVLVHCMKGMSRSSSMVISYLMHREGLKLNEALQLAKVPLSFEILQPVDGTHSEDLIPR